MSAIDVDLAQLATITQGLHQAAEGLEDLSGSVPSGIDAGPMTGVIASMIGQIVDSAANVSVALDHTGTNVGICREYYQRADASAEADFASIKEAMQP